MYCAVTCQKAHWKSHKYQCFKPLHPTRPRPIPPSFLITETLTPHIECWHSDTTGFHAVLRGDVKTDTEILTSAGIMRPMLFTPLITSHCYYCFSKLPNDRQGKVTEDRRGQPLRMPAHCSNVCREKDEFWEGEALAIDGVKANLVSCANI